MILGAWNLCSLKDQNSKSFNNTIPAICLDSNKNETVQLLTQISIQGAVEIIFEGGENVLRKLNKGGLIFAQVFLISFFSINIVLIVTKFIIFERKEQLQFTFSKFMFIVLLICKIFFNKFLFYFIKKKKIVNFLSISAFIDPLGYHGVITNYQFVTIITPITLIPFIISFNAISLNFSYLLVKMKNFPIYFKYIITVFTISLSSFAVLIYLIQYTKATLYYFESESITMSGRIVASIIMGIENLIFIIRSGVIFMKIRSFHVKSDQDLRKKSQYKKLFFWVCFLTVGYLIGFASSVVYIPDYINSPHKSFVNMFFLFLGYAISSFGILFVLKPHKFNHNRTSSISPTKDTNKLSHFNEN